MLERTAPLPLDYAACCRLVEPQSQLDRYSKEFKESLRECFCCRRHRGVVLALTA